MDEFELKFTKGNLNNSLPRHWDICKKGTDDSLVTIWTDEITAKAILYQLEQIQKGDTHADDH